MKVSFITPVYNTKEYLPECVESVLNQTDPSWELFLVDDGSDDGSEKLCDLYAASDSRIKVIHKENSGQFDSRLQGIKLATGDYCLGLDSDDYLEGNCVEKIRNAVGDLEYDIVAFNIRKVADHKVVSIDAMEQYGEYKNTDFLQYVALSMNHSFCNKAIKTNLLIESDYMNVPKDARHSEDYILICPAICMAKRILVIDEALYDYRQLESSVTHIYSAKRIIDYLDSSRCVRDILQRYGRLHPEIMEAENIALVRMVGYGLKRAYKAGKVNNNEARIIKENDIYKRLESYESYKYVSADILLFMKAFRKNWNYILRLFYGTSNE